ncbi:MAG TPA: HipA family kinase, partial [Mycobacteriales bacterium]|nr:HipA family kinase [Mycobacteriales bacterium]
YVTPLREGGSLPGLMEADDLGTYVVKFSGAGQGRKTLVAEVVAGQLARALGLPVPDLVTVQVDPQLAAGEPDQEVQDLLRRSGGLNVGMDYLPGALDLDPAAFAVAPVLAGRVLWFDALVGNVDRTWRNPNLLYWHGRLHLIDHGATLTFHHAWPSAAGFAERPYDARDHVLIGCAPDVAAADRELAPLVTPPVLAAATADVPERWLVDEPGFGGPEEVRAAYAAQMLSRLDARDAWLPALEAAAAAGEAARTERRASRPSWLEGRR